MDTNQSLFCCYGEELIVKDLFFTFGYYALFLFKHTFGHGLVMNCLS